jgi:hypothetical protein
MDKSNKLLIPVINYLFWVLLILFFNPGGIFEAFNIWYILGRFKMSDLLFIFMTICYVVIPKSHNNFDADFIKVRNYLLVFLIYYFIVFVYLVPFYSGNKDYSLIIALTKSRWALYSIFLFIYIYEFFKISYDVFIKIFVYSSALILVLFLSQIIIKINILPIEQLNRGFFNIIRMYNGYISDGLMLLLIPMGITIYVFKLKVKYKNMILIGFILMCTYYFVSSTRRDIISILIYFLLATLFNTFIEGSYKVFFNKMLKSALAIIFITIGIYFIFPKYVEAARIGIVESINIIEYGKEIRTGYKDERLGLRPFIVLQFIKHPYFGTGFDNRWRSREGDKLGFEASDYPFLAALAMFGVLGIMVFLPVYILLLKFLKNDLKYLRNKKNQNEYLLFLLLLTFILYFIYNLLQYWNYFLPVSNAGDYIWYSSLAFYLGARYKFYFSQSHSTLEFNLSSNLT